MDNRIAVLRMGKSWLTRPLTGAITSPSFDIPTTLARHGKDLFVVNARFAVADPTTAEYWITRERR
jgi:hypothetical protein